MIPWREIDRTVVPGAEVELRLMRRGSDFSMMLGPNELMSSRLSGSEQALATLACKRIEAVKRPHLLVGGLGMGFTLRAALAVLGEGARVTVAELVPAVIAWARGPMAEIFGNSFADPRADIS
jgi:spermidine synthase